jgi:hypothetical protein
MKLRGATCDLTFFFGNVDLEREIEINSANENGFNDPSREAIRL